MDEILASIRRIIADDGEGASVNAAAAPEDAHGVDGDAVHAPSPGLSWDDKAAVALPEVGFADLPASPSPSPFRVDPPPAATERPAAGTLVSREATESIGQAFNALSHTILSQNARTLEDLVKDMLRPMLKVWLDDNLPPLVERLVRAEIERVARGSR